MVFLSALIVALIGAFAGAALRPILDNYISMRRSRIEVNLPPNLDNNIILPYGMRIEWYGEILSKLNERAFFVRNLTGKTIRNVDIIVESLPLQEIVDNDAPYKYDIVIDSSLPDKFTVGNCDASPFSKVIKVENLRPDILIGGRILASLDHRPTFRVTSEHELIVTNKPITIGKREQFSLAVTWISVLLALTSAGVSIFFAVSGIAAGESWRPLPKIELESQ